MAVVVVRKVVVAAVVAAAVVAVMALAAVLNRKRKGSNREKTRPFNRRIINVPKCDILAAHLARQVITAGHIGVQRTFAACLDVMLWHDETAEKSLLASIDCTSVAWSFCALSIAFAQHRQCERART